MFFVAVCRPTDLIQNWFLSRSAGISSHWILFGRKGWKKGFFSRVIQNMMCLVWFWLLAMDHQSFRLIKELFIAPLPPVYAQERSFQIKVSLHRPTQASARNQSVPYNYIEFYLANLTEYGKLIMVFFLVCSSALMALLPLSLTYSSS